MAMAHTLTKCDDWNEFAFPDIVLEKGDNCIKLYNANGDFQLDCIYITEK